jgi:uncharacterized coiled-coil DUF342 family protein
MSEGNSLALMERIRERLVEESQQLDEDAAQMGREVAQLVRDGQRLDEEMGHLVRKAEWLNEDAARLAGRAATLSARTAALRALANDLLNTATLAESVAGVRAMEGDGRAG